MLQVQRCSFPSGPSNTPTCYEDSTLVSANLKLKCETRVLLPSVSAFYKPNIRLLFVSSSAVVKRLSNSVPDVSACHQYWDKTYMYQPENGVSVEQKNSLYAKLERPVDVMLSIIKSATMVWDLCHGSQRHTQDFSPV